MYKKRKLDMDFENGSTKIPKLKEVVNLPAELFFMLIWYLGPSHQIQLSRTGWFIYDMVRSHPSYLQYRKILGYHMIVKGVDMDRRGLI